MDLLTLWYMGIPVYVRIRTELEHMIRSGEFPPGSRLPTEAELQRQHSISRATAQRVLTELAQVGLAERYRRRGTFVADGPRQESLLRFVNPLLEGPEIPGRHELQSAAVIPAKDADIRLPGVPDGEPVHHIQRLKFDIDNNPIAVELSAIPFSLAPSLHEEDLTHLTVYDYFSRHDVPIAKSRVYIEPTILSQQTATQLMTCRGQAAIRLRRLTWLTNGKLAEGMWHLIRPSLVEFFVEHSIGGRAEE